MSECCASSSPTGIAPNKHACPINGNIYSSVPLSTVMHHINHPWHWSNIEENYYFCNDPECDVVYFGQSNSVINTSQLRTAVGIKEKSDNAIICYCFGITSLDAKTDPTTKSFVTRQTKKKTCACEARNPSGKCCLKDFPKS